MRITILCRIPLFDTDTGPTLEVRSNALETPTVLDFCRLRFFHIPSEDAHRENLALRSNAAPL